jgi:hypothetical protein
VLLDRIQGPGLASFLLRSLRNFARGKLAEATGFIETIKSCPCICAPQLMFFNSQESTAYKLADNIALALTLAST